MDDENWKILILAIGGLERKLGGQISTLDQKLTGQIDAGFAEVRKDLDVIKRQTAFNTETIASHEARFKAIEKSV